MACLEIILPNIEIVKQQYKIYSIKYKVSLAKTSSMF